MFWGKAIRTTLAVGAGSLALAFAGAAQAGVVVKSSGPSAAQYPVGKKLDDAASVTLREGDRLTVLADGGTRVITGPGTFPVAARGTSRRQTMAALTQQRARVRRIAGATRGELGAPGPDSNLWHIDIDSPGPVCLPDLSILSFYRKDTAQPATYMIAAPGSADHMHIAFSAGQTIIDWDADSPVIEDGVEYVVTGPGGDVAGMTFRMLAEPATTGEALAIQLIEHGCEAQLEILAQKMM